MPAIGSQSLSVFVVYCNDMRAPQLTMVGAKIVDPSRSGELWRPDTLMHFGIVVGLHLLAIIIIH